MNENIKSEYSHISSCLDSIEKDVLNLVTDVNNIKADLKNLTSFSDDLKNDTKKILIAANNFENGCVRLENYLDYIQNTFFPNLEYKLVTKIELCSNSTVDKIKEEVELYGKKTENAMIENQDELMKLLNTINNKLN
uniref:Uncharacterized protein n=1 Tax=Ulva intestinalis TaxID=3116 RepID=A0A8F5ANZ4_ULVIN|nr:hypothetical protein [Ulva intestinalis]